ncbi:hypothetical protein GCM10027517_24060 [Phycicoccus ginsengisoli]
MLTSEETSVLLHSWLTDFPDRARNVLVESQGLTDEERSALWGALTSEPQATALDRLGEAMSSIGAPQDLVNEVYRAAFYAGPHWAALVDDTLFAHFAANRAGKVIDKWPHYFPVYTRYLSKYVGRAPRVLEIGVYRGGSMQMWSRFFGEGAQLVGLDIDEAALVAARDSAAAYTVVLADQEDPEALARVADEHGPFDVILDDGGHTMTQQIVSVETLFPRLAEGGTYIVEDCHTSYWPEYGGGLDREGTFMEWAKARLDDVNGYHFAGGVHPLWTRHVDGIHVHDSLVVLEKAHRFAPFSEQTGGAEFAFGTRRQSAIASEVVATRQAALADRDVARAALVAAEEQHATELAQAREAIDQERSRTENDLRRLRGELRGYRDRLSEAEKKLAETDAELEQTRNNLLESWQHVREMRQTVSWRATAPVRRLRRPR